MKVRVICTSMMPQVSPHPEHNFVTYRFALDGLPPKELNTGYLDGGYWINLDKPSLYEVGKVYELEISIK